MYEPSKKTIFNLKKVGFQTNKSLNWPDGRYTYLLISWFLNGCFIVLRQQEHLKKTLMR